MLYNTRKNVTYGNRSYSDALTILCAFCKLMHLLKQINASGQWEPSLWLQQAGTALPMQTHLTLPPSKHPTCWSNTASTSRTTKLPSISPQRQYILKVTRNFDVTAKHPSCQSNSATCGRESRVPYPYTAFLFCTTNPKLKPLDALHPNQSYRFTPNKSYGLTPTPSLGHVYTVWGMQSFLTLSKLWRQM